MNIGKTLEYLFPYSDPIFDFIVQDDGDGKGQYISQWNLSDPIPTQQELEDAWEIVKNIDTNTPHVSDEVAYLKNELINTQIALIETYEQLLQAQDESTSTQQALVDVYELLLNLMDAIMLEDATEEPDEPIVEEPPTLEPSIVEPIEPTEDTEEEVE
jgi:hypothetical protein